MAGQLEEVKISILTNADGTNKSFKELQKTSKNLKDTLGTLEVGSKDYIETLKELAVVQGKVNKINRDARNATANLTDVYAGLTRSVVGVASGFQVAQSAMTLFGGESENLVKTIAKFQAFQGFVQGLYGLSNGIKSATNLLPRLTIAFKALNAIMKANPALAVASGIAALGAIALTVAANIGTNRDEIEKANEAYNTYKTTISDLERETEYYLRVLRAQGTAEAEIIQARIDSNNKLVEESLNAIKNLFDGYDFQWQNVYKNIDNYRDADRRKFLLNFRFIKGVTQEQLDGLFDDYFRFYDRIGQLNEDARIQDIKDDKAAADDLDRRQKTAYAKQQAELKKQIDERRAFYEELERQQIEYFEALERNVKQYGYQIGQAGRDILYEIEQELLDEEIEIPFVTKLEDFSSPEAIEQRRQQYQEEIGNLKEIYEAFDEGTFERSQAIVDYQNTYENFLAFQKQATNIEIELDKKRLASQQALYSGIGTLLGATSQLLGQHTVAGKLLAVAESTINTYLAASQVLRNPLQLSPTAKWVQFGATISLGLANVANIVKTKVPGASDTTSSANVSTPSLPTMPDIDTSAFEVYSNINPADVDELNQTRTVLVVEDVNEVQGRVKVAEDSATF